VMLIGGLWHGASWNYVIWGGIHGTMLAAERFHGKHGPFPRLPRPAQVAFTFLVIVVAWVFFRAKDLPSALAYCRSLAGLGHPSDGARLIAGLIFQPYYLGSFLLAGVVAWSAPQTWDWTRSLSFGKAAILLGLLWLSIVVMTTQAYNPFIYFIF